MTRGEFRSHIPKEKPEPSGLLRIVLVLAIIGVGAAFLVARYAEKTQRIVVGGAPPQEAQQPGAAEMPADAPRAVIYRGKFGQFLARGWIEGQEIVFVIDTGASHVVLSPADAQRVGLQPLPEQFTRIAQTASGSVKAAPVMLRRVSLGGVHVDDVETLINSVPMGYSLLGMSFLNRLSAVDVRGDQMILVR